MEATVSKAEYDELKQQNAKLQHELDQLKRLIFGASKERFVPSVAPEQLDLWELDQATDEGEVDKEKISYERKKKAHPGRTQLPDHLPVEEIIIEPEEDTTGMVKIGEEVTETLDYRPGVLLKRRYIRKKYARTEETPDAASILIGELPERPIPKGTDSETPPNMIFAALGIM